MGEAKYGLNAGSRITFRIRWLSGVINPFA